MSNNLILGALLLVAVVLAALLYPAKGPEGTLAGDAELGLSDVLGSDALGEFARATDPYRFSFPRDHGPHPKYRSEWWYFTGNLSTERGRRFGFQLTFFRFALAPDPPESRSAWATNQAWMAHFAVTDVAGERFHSFERLSRGVLEMSGARDRPFRVWLEDWEVGAITEDTFPLRMVASQDGVSLSLEVQGGKALVLQGVEGLSQKAAEPGNASYYYSKTRLPVSGYIETPESGRQAVSGLAWLDREWGTSSLGPDQVGWDWFALQLSDGVDLMFYSLRQRDGQADPHSAGSLVDASGKVVPLTRDDVRIEVLDRWRSDRTGAVYPSRWRLVVPAAALDVQIRPQLPDQEMDHSVRYWEGAVTVEGTRGGRPARGYGYVEMTGYDTDP